jgi:hypothetical protein
MNQSDETLMAYVDGELDGPARAAFEAAMARDPQLALRVARQQAVRAQLRRAFDATLDEPVPPRLLASVGATHARNSRAPLPGTNWLAMAASVVVGVLLGYGVSSWTGSQPNIADGRAGPAASGELARALTRRLAAEQGASDTVRVGLSYRSRTGEYCRTFIIGGASEVAGLACRSAEQWGIRVLEAGAGTSTAPGGLRQAGSSLPDSVRAAVEASIDGEPLDAAGEARAREQGWRTVR